MQQQADSVSSKSTALFKQNICIRDSVQAMEDKKAMSYFKDGKGGREREREQIKQHTQVHRKSAAPVVMDLCSSTSHNRKSIL